ncbi:MAG TPA: hypothetical protein VGR22_09895 [Thermomicrobiales bacterium]|nr:hypothetical protein [Thermomicrobiales bacterium]
MISRFVLLLSILAAMFVSIQATSAQGEDQYTAAIVSGRCIDIGEAVLVLDTPQYETGEWRGTEGAPVVLESDNDDIGEVPASVLFDTPHSVVVLEDDDPVACGEFGGLVGVEEDQDLIFGLSPVNDSGYVGVVVVNGVSRDDEDDEFEVDVYVIDPESLAIDEG